MSETAWDRLLELPPFEWNSRSSEAFLESFRETATHHYRNCPDVRFFWDEAGITPDEIKTEEDLKRVPPVLVNIFKERILACQNSGDTALTLKSSGTGGQHSLQILNSQSLRRVKELAWHVHQALGLCSEQEANYICFTYDPARASDVGTAFTDELLTSFTPRKEVYYALKFDPRIQDFYFDAEETMAMFERFAADRIPCRILGFPAFLVQLVRHHGLNVTLPAGSMMETGGGFKNHGVDAISREEFRDLMSLSLGIPREAIRDLFGMVEHGIPYIEDEQGRFRVPNLARIFIRDPYTLEALPTGQTGLIHFLCTYNSSYANSSLLSTDWGRLLPAPDPRGPIIEFTGRAGVSRHKGCALHAQRLLRQK